MRRLVLTGAALLAVGAVTLFLWRFLAIDRCLDDGGGWNYRENKCECARTELAKPNLSKDYVAYCNSFDPDLADQIP